MSTRMSETTPTSPYNVYMAGNKNSKLTWEEFKNKIERNYNWIYDSESKVFYKTIMGQRRTLPQFRLHMLAFLYGYYDNMSEYIE